VHLSFYQSRLVLIFDFIRATTVFPFLLSPFQPARHRRHRRHRGEESFFFCVRKQHTLNTTTYEHHVIEHDTALNSQNQVNVCFIIQTNQTVHKTKYYSTIQQLKRARNQSSSLAVICYLLPATCYIPPRK